jgi:uncharacterized protein YutE (UPF0331/DUF86 family)
MMNKGLIKRRLAELRKNIEALRAFSGFGLEDLRKDVKISWAVEHGLQLSIQLVLDIGSHLLAELGENNLEDYADIIAALGRVGILPLEFSQKIKPMAGFRNLLVHEYAEIDLGVVYRVLKEGLLDFETFGQYIETYLDEESGL